MIAEQFRRECYSWADERCPFSVELPVALASRLRAIAVTGLRALPHGGMEMGGLLMGSHDDSRVRIADLLTIPCEHAVSPKFILSETDKAAVRAMIEKHRESNPDSEVVGWYVSHSRTGLGLTEQDLEFCNEFFREPWQVALVLKPHKYDPARAGFFFREPDGGIRPDAAYKEFLIHEADRVTDAPDAKAPAMEGPGENEQSAAPRGGEEDGATSWAVPARPSRHDEAWADEKSLESEEQEDLRASRPRRGLARDEARDEDGEGEELRRIAFSHLDTTRLVERRSRSKAWQAAAAAVVVLAIGALYFMDPAARETSGTALRVSGTGAELRIEWDPAGPEVREATGGIIEIEDGPGNFQVIPLTALELSRGTLEYHRVADEVRVVLRTTGSGDVLLAGSAIYAQPMAPAEAAGAQTEAAQIEPFETSFAADRITPPLNTSAAENRAVPPRAIPEARVPDPPAPARANSDVMPQPVVGSRTPEPVVSADTAKPVVNSGATQPPGALARVEQSEPAAAPRPAQPTRTFPLPGPPKPPAREDSVQLAQSLLNQAPQVNVGGAPLPTTGLLATPPLTPPPATPPPPAPKPQLPASGRAIWTGMLPRDSLLVIDGGRPSTGALTGSIPQGPVRVRAYPGELVNGGIVVYSRSGDGRASGYSEAPGPQNGWNTTVFQQDAQRAAELRALEIPSAANNWGKTILRNSNRPLSVLFLEWERCDAAAGCTQ